MRREDLLEEDETLRRVDKLNKLVRKVKVSKTYRDELKNIPNYKTNIKTFVPVIFVSGLSMFYLNVGGSPFL